MTRLNWEKARRRELPVQPYQSERQKRNHERTLRYQRQLSLIEFVQDRNLKCFVCGEGHVSGLDWATTGVSKKGPWAIHVECVKIKR